LRIVHPHSVYPSTSFLAQPPLQSIKKHIYSSTQSVAHLLLHTQVTCTHTRTYIPINTHTHTSLHTGHSQGTPFPAQAPPHSSRVGGPIVRRGPRCGGLPRQGGSCCCWVLVSYPACSSLGKIYLLPSLLASHASYCPSIEKLLLLGAGQLPNMLIPR